MIIQQIMSDVIRSRPRGGNSDGFWMYELGRYLWAKLHWYSLFITVPVGGAWAYFTKDED